MYFEICHLESLVKCEIVTHLDQSGKFCMQWEVYLRVQTDLFADCRCQIDKTEKWHMVCGKCWNEVSSDDD